MTEKLKWLSILQGWSMLLVVVGHVVLTDDMFDENYPLSSYLYCLIYSFHMPLFIFISGWLLNYTCIKKNKPYIKMIKSKTKRLLIPFYTFTIITIVIKILLSSFIKRPIDSEELINTFIFYSSNPLKALWFIIVLFIMLLGYPIYIWMIKSKLREIMMLLIAICLFFYFPDNIHIFFFNKFKYLYFFFLAGIIVSNHQIIERMNLFSITICSICLFIFFNIFNAKTNIIAISFINNISGILFSVCTCMYIEKFRPSFFSSFRDYTYQIYLISMFPQMALRVIYMQFDLKSFYIIMFILSIILGLYLPTFISKFCLNNPTRFNKYIGL